MMLQTLCCIIGYQHIHKRTDIDATIYKHAHTCINITQIDKAMYTCHFQIVPANFKCNLNDFC